MKNSIFPLWGSTIALVTASADTNLGHMYILNYMGATRLEKFAYLPVDSDEKRELGMNQLI